MQTQPLSPSPFADRAVGDLVSEDYRFAEVFKRHGIDFCCGGGRTVRKACSKKNISPDVLEQEYHELTDRAPTGIDDPVHHMDAEQLMQHIQRVHHGYVRRNLPLLQELTTKVARVHGHAHPELSTIAQLVQDLASDLSEHMEQEEKVLFPSVRQLMIAATVSRASQHPCMKSVNLPVGALEDDHTRSGALMHRVRKLSADFTPPEYACNSWVVAFRKLEEFENDLHRHVHLENNVLFPMVRKLERELTN